MIFSFKKLESSLKVLNSESTEIITLLWGNQYLLSIYLYYQNEEQLSWMTKRWEKQRPRLVPIEYFLSLTQIYDILNTKRLKKEEKF